LIQTRKAKLPRVKNKLIFGNKQVRQCCEIYRTNHR
jgi:hypothetical protein